MTIEQFWPMDGDEKKEAGGINPRLLKRILEAKAMNAAVPNKT